MSVYSLLAALIADVSWDGVHATSAVIATSSNSLSVDEKGRTPPHGL